MKRIMPSDSLLGASSYSGSAASSGWAVEPPLSAPAVALTSSESLLPSCSSYVLGIDPHRLARSHAARRYGGEFPVDPAQYALQTHFGGERAKRSGREGSFDEPLGCFEEV